MKLTSQSKSMQWMESLNFSCLNFLNNSEPQEPTETTQEEEPAEPAEEEVRACVVLLRYEFKLISMHFIGLL